MKENKKRYWNGIEQLSNDPEFVNNVHKEFAQELPVREKDDSGTSGSRRDFLKMMGFSVAAASLAACEAPVRKAIPYLNKPVDVDPGIPNYYASTYSQAGNFCSILVKTREGRPIKISGNKLSSISKGGTNAPVEASVLSLYDNERLRDPLFEGKATTWEDADKDIIEKLDSIVQAGGQIRIISNTLLSPSTHAVINEFINKYPTAGHITYDTDSYHGIKEANRLTLGNSIIPYYKFSGADVIVGFDVDFLGSWLDPIGFSREYASNRKINKDHRKMSRHYQYESLLSLTGANADYRIQVNSMQQPLVIGKLYNLIAAKAGQPQLAINDPGKIKFLQKSADNLWAARGKSLVISGSNDPDVQILINGINAMLENYGATIDLSNPVNFRQGDEKAMDDFIAEIKKGRVDGVIFYNSNPVYNHPMGAELAEALQNASLTVTTSDRLDETASLCTYVVPDHHYLESWNDAEPIPGHLTLTQPTITPLFNTRQAQQSFLTWTEAGTTDYFEYLKSQWEKNYYPGDAAVDFQTFWDKSLHDGVLSSPREAGEVGSYSLPDRDLASAINEKYPVKNEGFELVLYRKVAVGDGTDANNPWLQEMPDPITKTTWDNYLTISMGDAKELGIYTEGNRFMTVRLTAGEKTLTLPVLIQPGQARGSLGLAVGYGREKAGKVGNGLGVNAYPLMANRNGFWSNMTNNQVSLEVLDERYRIAQTQTHHTYMDRENVIQEAYLPEYQADPKAGRVYPKIHTSRTLDKKIGDEHIDGEVEPYAVSLWKGHEYPNHHWGMTIDLNSCIGCGACTIACQVENNVPVVGKEEVLNRREMHWIRIDRYYSSDAPPDDWVALEKAAENPEVTFQPLMCQHCNNAPCETVCPVVATTHSSEGLNQMTYNRCIGTRYCANNCPYKVRRFNWFKYHDNSKFADNTPMLDDLGKMVLNPDVVVRSRGVMEKCSLCIQRIQYGKLEAKKEGRRPRDGEINTACAEACPTQAIVFGDMNDKESRISGMLRLTEKDGVKKVQEERAYHVLEEVRTMPNIFYYTKIRNKDLEDKNA